MPLLHRLLLTVLTIPGTYWMNNVLEISHFNIWKYTVVELIPLSHLQKKLIKENIVTEVFGQWMGSDGNRVERRGGWYKRNGGDEMEEERVERR